MNEDVLVSASLDNYDTVEAWVSEIHNNACVLVVNTNSGGIFLTKEEMKALIDGLQKLIGEIDVRV
jgi:hypothetical protein